jgi:hypothetical protein
VVLERVLRTGKIWKDILEQLATLARGAMGLPV